MKTAVDALTNLSLDPEAQRIAWERDRNERGWRNMMGSARHAGREEAPADGLPLEFCRSDPFLCGLQLLRPCALARGEGGARAAPKNRKHDAPTGDPLQYLAVWRGALPTVFAGRPRGTRFAGAVADVYGRVGTSQLATYVCAGVRALGIPLTDRVRVGGEFDVWNQPTTVASATYVSTIAPAPLRVGQNQFGLNVGAYVDVGISDRWGFTAKDRQAPPHAGIDAGPRER